MSSNSSSSRRQQMHDKDDKDGDIAAVMRLIDSLEVDHQSSGTVEKLKRKRSQKHEEALKQLKSELSHLSQECELEVRTISEQVLSSLREADIRLNTLKDRIGHQTPITLQVLHCLWEEVEEEGRQKKIQISELDQTLSRCEKSRREKLKVILKKYCHLLELISFLSPPDVHRLIHDEATALNHALLANQCSIARLVMLLKQENLQQQALIRRHWEDRLDQWRNNKVEEMVQQLRSLCSSGKNKEQELLLDQQMKQTKEDLIKQRCDIIYKICSLVPPTCSSALVSDWFNELITVNQLIDHLHADFIHQLRGFYQHTWQHRLAEVERCKEELLALQLSDQQMKEIVTSQLLPIIGQEQRKDEDRLAALQMLRDSVGRHVVWVSGSVFEVLQALALLWKRHCCGLEKRKEELNERLKVLTEPHQQRVQEKMLKANVLLEALSQGESEDALQRCLQNTLEQLKDVEESCRQFVTDQWELLDQLPALHMEELLSYSSSITSYFRLSPTFRPETMETYQESSISTRIAIQARHEPISSEKETDPAPNPEKWPTEGASPLLQVCDISSSVTFTSTAGVVYTGPAFVCPAPTLPDSMPHEYPPVFPVELLVHTLSRTRILVLDHVEQSFKDLPGLVEAMVKERKESVRLEQELQLKSEYIRTYIYEPRLAELQLHQQHVDDHCQDMLHILAFSKEEFQGLQKSLQEGNLEFLKVLNSHSRELQQLKASIQKDAQDGLHMALTSCNSLDAFGSTLRSCLQQHAADIQSRKENFRLSIQSRMEEVRRRTSHLLKSFRKFHEGGSFAPREVEKLQGSLQRKTRQIYAAEQKIYKKLMVFEPDSSAQVRKASTSLEDEFSSLQTEVKFNVKVQEIISRTQIKIRAEEAKSNQLQSELMNKLKELRRMMKKNPVSPEQICSFISSTNEGIKKHCLYLGFDLSGTLSPESRTPVQSGSLKLRGMDLDLHGEPAAVSSFSSSLTSILRETKDVLLQLAKEFYCREHLCEFSLLPKSVEQWAKRMQQQELGYQEQGRTFLRKSKDELVRQLFVFRGLLRSLPEILITNHEGQHVTWLTAEVGAVQEKLEKQLATSEEEKNSNFYGLKVSLGEKELQTLNSKEELRQQQQLSATLNTHLELQECLRRRAEEFVTSLSSLTEKLLHLLDELLIAEEPDPAKPPSAVTTATEAETGSELRGSREWLAIACCLANLNLAESFIPRPASITTARTSRNLVIEQRDAALKRFQQLIQSEESSSDVSKEKQLGKQHSWTSYWKRQILAMRKFKGYVTPSEDN